MSNSQLTCQVVKDDKFFILSICHSSKQQKQPLFIDENREKLINQAFRSTNTMTKLKNKDAERLNPCLKEQEMSYKCLSKNGYDNSKCEDYFDNYNTCKKFWGKVYSDRKAKGLYPYMPEVEDRAGIKEQYFKSVKDSF